jgi:hypothetical protein
LSGIVSLELQNILNVFAVTETNLNRILTYLNCLDHNELNQRLEQALLIRQQHSDTYLYILQQSQQTPCISYAVSPLLCSVLDYPTHYVAQAETWLADFYQHYFRLEALESTKNQSLEQIYLAVDLRKEYLNPKEFYLASLLQSLLDPRTKTVVTLGETCLIPELKQQLMAYYTVTILEMSQPLQRIELNEIEHKKLFWKRKDQYLAKVSQQISFDNAHLVEQLCHLSLTDAERFIEDLMYGEHIFEKVSVLGEFSDTIYKHQLQHEKSLSA